MAEDLGFDSLGQMDDLDWSELEENTEEETETTEGNEPVAEREADAVDTGGGAASPPMKAAKGGAAGPQIDINYLLDVNLHLTVEVGRKQVYISSILAYDHGSVVELEKAVGEPLDLLVNNTRVARGEVVVVNEKFALKIIEILDPQDRLSQIM